jgi:hypothetical protein
MDDVPGIPHNLFTHLWFIDVPWVRRIVMEQKNEWPGFQGRKDLADLIVKRFHFHRNQIENRRPGSKLSNNSMSDSPGGLIVLMAAVNLIAAVIICWKCWQGMF